MLRTTSTARATLAGLMLLATTPLSAAPAAPAPEQVYSVVAQSTADTAATGRRPIGLRIAASNLPVRTPHPVDRVEQSSPVAPLEDVAKDLEAVAAAPEPPLPADPPAAEVADDAALDESPTPVAGMPDTAVEPAAVVELAGEPVAEPVAEPAAPPAASAFAEPAPPAGESSSDVAAVADHQPVKLAARAPARVAPVPLAEARPAMPPAARANLLSRIKTAFGIATPAARPAGKPATNPAAAPAAEPPASDPPPPPAAAEQAATPPHEEPAEAVAQAPVQIEAHIQQAQPQATPLAPAVAVAESPRDAAASPAIAAEALAPALAEPARLEFDVRESRCLVGEGEQIVMRIAVRNIGGETAERVTATLFFAEGIEPVQAVGHAAAVYPGEVRFETLPRLSPGENVDLIVTAVTTRVGNVAYRGELESRQPAARVAREGTVTIRARQPAAR